MGARSLFLRMSALAFILAAATMRSHAQTPAVGAPLGMAPEEAIVGVWAIDPERACVESVRASRAAGAAAVEPPRELAMLGSIPPYEITADGRLTYPFAGAPSFAVRLVRVDEHTVRVESDTQGAPTPITFVFEDADHARWPAQRAFPFDIPLTRLVPRDAKTGPPPPNEPHPLARVAGDWTVDAERLEEIPWLDEWPEKARAQRLRSLRSGDLEFVLSEQAIDPLGPWAIRAYTPEIVVLDVMSLDEPTEPVMIVRIEIVDDENIWLWWRDGRVPLERTAQAE